MASLSVLTPLLFFVLFSLSMSITPAVAGPKKKLNSVARKEDIPFIRCQVCQKIAHQIHSQVSAKDSQISPKKVTEYQIIEIVENVCNLKKQEADWILQIDIVENGDKLELVDQGTEGQCNSECKTIERACQEEDLISLVESQSVPEIAANQPRKANEMLSAVKSMLTTAH